MIPLEYSVARRRMVREHFQEQAAPLPLARNLLRWLSRPAERQAFYGDVRTVREMCGESGVWERTAREIMSLTAGQPAARSAGGEA